MKFSAVFLLSLIKCRLNIAPFVRRHRQHTKDVCFLFRKKENEEKTSAKYMIMQIALQKDGVFPLYGLLFIIGAIFTHCSPACRVHPLVVLFTK